MLTSSRQGAAVASTPSFGHVRLMVRTICLLVLAALLGTAASVASASPTRAAVAPKAVIIVGPGAEHHHDYMSEGRLFAAQAEAAGMDVHRVIHPRATWKRVLKAIDGANLVVYFGHGNGWPSPYAPFQENTKDGFGLNAYEGASTWSTKYYGGNYIRDKVRLAHNAVVILYRSCYSAGNGENGQRLPSRHVAAERVDNYAAAFLTPRVGAAVVMSYRTKQWVNYAAKLMRPGRTMDMIFQRPSRNPSWAMSGWIGRIPFVTNSERTHGARLRLDEDPQGGFSRSITGNLQLTTDQWLEAAAGS